MLPVEFAELLQQYHHRRKLVANCGRVQKAIDQGGLHGLNARCILDGPVQRGPPEPASRRMWRVSWSRSHGRSAAQLAFSQHYSYLPSPKSQSSQHCPWSRPKIHPAASPISATASPRSSRFSAVLSPSSTLPPHRLARGHGWRRRLGGGTTNSCGKCRPTTKHSRRCRRRRPGGYDGPRQHDSNGVFTRSIRHLVPAVDRAQDNDIELCFGDP